MNKTELINAVAKAADLSRKDADKAVTALFDIVTETLKKGDKVQIVGFGAFEAKERAARTARNPRTGEEIEIPASKAVSFKVGKALALLVHCNGAVRVDADGGAVVDQIGLFLQVLGAVGDGV